MFFLNEKDALCVPRRLQKPDVLSPVPFWVASSRGGQHGSSNRRSRRLVELEVLGHMSPPVLRLQDRNPVDVRFIPREIPTKQGGLDWLKKRPPVRRTKGSNP